MRRGYIFFPDEKTGEAPRPASHSLPWRISFAPAWVVVPNIPSLPSSSPLQGIGIQKDRQFQDFLETGEEGTGSPKRLLVPAPITATTP